MRLTFIVPALALAALSACGSSGSSNPSPTATPGPLSAMPSSATMSVTGAGGSPQVVTITFSQSEVTSKPAITVGSDQTCVSTPPAASDVLKTNGIASSNFNSATGTLTVTQAFTAHIPGSCTYVLVSAAGPQTASVNFTVDK